MTLTIDVFPAACNPTIHISAFLEKSKDVNHDIRAEKKEGMAGEFC
jgi:hypothetical protein